MSSQPSPTNVSTIAVRVALFADLRRYLPKGESGPRQVRLPAGATVADLLATLGIAETDEVTAGRNGEQALHDAELHDGDDLVLFSPMEGG